MIQFYFGYMPIHTFDGKITEETISELQELTGDEIKAMSTITEVRSMDTVIELTNKEDFIIPSDISEEELAELISGGTKYNNIADEYNNCVVLMVPLARYNSPRFDIIDERFNQSIKNLFCKINCVEVSCMRYVLLCMVNDKWAYSTVGKDKVIAPLKLIIKL